MNFEFSGLINADQTYKQQPANVASGGEVAQVQQPAEEPVIAPANSSATAGNSTTGSVGAPAGVTDATTTEEESGTAVAQQPAIPPSNPSGGAAQNKPRLFTKRKKKEPLALTAARVHKNMIEQATGLQTPPNPPIGYWSLSVSYSELGNVTGVCKRNMQRVMKLLKSTGKVKAEQEPTFTRRGVYKVIPETQITSEVVQ